MVAISLILIGGCSVLRSRTSLRTSRSKVPRRAAACSAPNRPRMPSFSKPMIRRRRVVSGVPVWRALSVTGLPKTTGGRIRSYSTCSGHFRSSLSCPQSSVGSTRVRLAICRSPPATPFLLPPASSFPSPRADVAISSGSSHSSSVFRGDRMPRQWTRGKFPPPMIQICVTSLWRGLLHQTERQKHQQLQLQEERGRLMEEMEGWHQRYLEAHRQIQQVKQQLKDNNEEHLSVSQEMEQKLEQERAKRLEADQEAERLEQEQKHSTVESEKLLETLREIGDNLQRLPRSS